jgi:hypothetical protein
VFVLFPLCNALSALRLIRAVLAVEIVLLFDDFLVVSDRRFKIAEFLFGP